MPDHLITAHGAVPGADIPATAAVQAALDAAHADGGGRVVIPPGRYVIGTIHLRSRVELHLENGARLEASQRRSDYQERETAAEYGGNEGGFLIVADDCEDLAITGLGTIDGRATAFMAGPWHDGPWIMKPQPWRPRLIGLFGCRTITIRDLTLRDAAQWTCHLTGCSDVVIDGLRIYNRLDVPNCDGIDPDHCQNVRIANCHIEAGDDGIVLKATKPFTHYGPTENVVIENCTVVSTSAAIKIGTESASDFRAIVIRGCVVRRSHRALAIQLRDSGNVEDIIISDCVVETRRFHDSWWGNAEPLAITCRPRREGERVGRVRGVTVRGLRARGEGGVFIAGCAESPIEDLVLEDLTVAIGRTSRWQGGWRDYRPCAGQEHGGREADVEAGVHLEHVDGVRLRDVRVRFVDPQPAPWYGPAWRQEQVRGIEGRVAGDDAR